MLLNKISNAQPPNWLWATNAGGTDYDYASSVAVDASGNLYVAGLFRSPTLNFGSYTLTNAGAGTISDMFLAKLGNRAGINESGNSSNISVFPNPATDKITIEITGIFKASYLSIVNIEGQQVITRQIKEPQT